MLRVEFTPFPQYIIDLNHKVISWNKSCELLTGMTEREIIGTNNQGRAFYGNSRNVMADLIADGKVNLISELYKEKCKNSLIVPNAWEASDFFPICGGKPRHLYWWAAPIYDQGKLVGVVTTIQDITENKYWELQIEKQTILQNQIQLRTPIQKFYENVVCSSRSMQNVYSSMIKSSASDANIVIYGESGTGKEAVARAIHNMSKRSGKEFIAVNCGAIPETLMETEFFGHSKGSFTGANKNKRGYLDFANGGTLFLDEVGEISHGMQVKLLRAIESKEYMPLGGDQMQRSDFRIVCATNKNLEYLVKKGILREDFYYRINVIPIHIPPLRDRKEDLAILIEHFMGKFNDKNNPIRLPGKVVEVFYRYDWPGNIRELQNIIQRCLTLNNFDFVQNLRYDRNDDINDIDLSGSDLKTALRTFEKKYISTTLDRMKWRKTNTAKALRISRRTLFRKMNDHGLIQS